METTPRWIEAQETEVSFWNGVVKWDHTVLEILAANSAKAALLSRALSVAPVTALEVGVGPFGLGIIGFLPQIPKRYGLDPLPPVPMTSADQEHAQLLRFMGERRAAISYVVACGEQIPFRSESMDLVICCNVIDHAFAPETILGEIHRVLKPDGAFFFDVHTFSALGLVKWHLWTKHIHKDESLVISHPYRMFERDVRQKLHSCGFREKTLYGHTLVSSVVGHARASTFLATKRSF
jgi:SAM-dependent methyltransferase